MRQRRLPGRLARHTARPSAPPAHVCAGDIVRNLSLKACHHNTAARRGSAYTVALEELEGRLAAPHTADVEVETRELARMTGGFPDTLTPENRVIFMRRYWFDDSYRDIAGALFRPAFL